VKWRPDLRQWVFDWNGIPEAEARQHGYLGLPRAAQPVHVVIFTRAIARGMLAAMDLTLAQIAEKAALEAERKAAATERRRAHCKIYFAAWYSINRGKVAARRRAQREAAKVAKRVSF
jgi:hypothetical protein